MLNPDLPFSKAEFQRRVTKSRQAMEAKGIDVLFLVDPSNQNWLTGYDGWSFYVHQGVILEKDGAPYWWGRFQDTNGALRTIWMEDAQSLVQSMSDKPYIPDVAIVGKPTSMCIIEGHKGCYEYTTRFGGFEGYGSQPDPGVNAVEYAVRFINRLLELKSEMAGRAPAGCAFEPPWITINTGQLHGGTARNIIAGKAEIEWEMRPVQKSDADRVKAALHEYCTQVLLPEMKSVYPGSNIETEIVAEVEGLVRAAANEARDIIAELTGTNGTDLVSFGTEGGLYQSLGIDVVVCGPGSIEQAHKPDEFVSVDQLQSCIEMLERLGSKLCNDR